MAMANVSRGRRKIEKLDKPSILVTWVFGTINVSVHAAYWAHNAKLHVSPSIREIILLVQDVVMSHARRFGPTETDKNIASILVGLTNLVSAIQKMYQQPFANWPLIVTRVVGRGAASREFYQPKLYMPRRS
jgi:hypothetical protein